MIIATTHIRPKKLNSLLVPPSRCPYSMSQSWHFSGCFLLKHTRRVAYIRAVYFYLWFPTAAPHAECTLRPILARFVAASISRMPLAAVDGRQVPRGRSRGYGRQFDGAFSPRLSIRIRCLSIYLVDLSDMTVSSRECELTQKKTPAKRATRHSSLCETGDVLTFAAIINKSFINK